MAPRLSASSFALGKRVPYSEMPFIPFQHSDTPEKLDWANDILDMCYNPDDVVEIQINQGYGCPSVATYVSWLQRALKASWRGDTKTLQTTTRGNSLYVRVIDKKESRKHGNGKVKHVIT